MSAGKFRLPPNVLIGCTLVLTLCFLALMVSLAWLACSAPDEVQPEPIILGQDVQTYDEVQPELFIMGINMKTYDLDADQWSFPLTLFGFGIGDRTARLVEFSIDGHNLIYFIIEPQRTLSVHFLDNEIDRESFRKWHDHMRRVAIARVRDDEQVAPAVDEERELMKAFAQVKEIMRHRREIVPISLVVDVAELPFQVAADGHYKVRVAVERGQTNTVWEGEILIFDVGPLDTSF